MAAGIKSHTSISCCILDVSLLFVIMDLCRGKTLLFLQTPLLTDDAVCIPGDMVLAYNLLPTCKSLMNTFSGGLHDPIVKRCIWQTVVQLFLSKPCIQLIPSEFQTCVIPMRAVLEHDETWVRWLHMSPARFLVTISYATRVCSSEQSSILDDIEKLHQVCINRGLIGHSYFVDQAVASTTYMATHTSTWCEDIVTSCSSSFLGVVITILAVRNKDCDLPIFDCSMLEG